MTTRSSKTLASCAVMALSVAATPFAQAKDKPEIDYFLSRTDVAVAVAMTLVSCPSKEDEPPVIEVEWSVVPTASADTAKPVHVDVSSGFLAKRSNTFEFYPNGTLAGFNGSSQGQAGPLLVSVLKTVAAIAPVLSASSGDADSSDIEALDPPQLTGPRYCSDEVVGTLKKLADTKAEIGALENAVLAHTVTSADLDLLERRRLKKLSLIKALSFEEGILASPDGGDRWTGRIEVSKLVDDWFSQKPGKNPSAALSFDSAKIVGIDGYDVVIRAVGDLAADVSPVQQSASEPDKGEKLGLHRSLYYRRPRFAEIGITDTNCRPVKDCSETLELDAPLPIGQWGKVSSLPVGNAGLFGRREATASFDPFGTPLKLSYGSDSGAADIGSTIEAAGGTVTAIADSESAALERKIKREELRQKLRELRATADE